VGEVLAGAPGAGSHLRICSISPFSRGVMVTVAMRSSMACAESSGVCRQALPQGMAATGTRLLHHGSQKDVPPLHHGCAYLAKCFFFFFFF